VADLSATLQNRCQLVAYIVRQFTCPKAVTHPTTNWAQCSTTALIETNALPLH